MTTTFTTTTAFNDRLKHAEFHSWVRPQKENFLGATSPKEQGYCAWVASQLDLSLGGIADLGCWLGSTTASMARGLEANPTLAKAHAIPCLHSFDQFKWTRCFEDWVKGTGFAGRFEEGEDFSAAAEAHIKGLLPRPEVSQIHTVDLEVFQWSGDPLVLILNDVWKTPALAHNTVKQLLPALVPDAGILINEDYLWCTDWIIHPFMYALRDYFVPVFRVESSPMVVWRATAPVPADIVLPEDPKMMARAEMEEAFAWSRSLFQGEERDLLWLTQAWAHYDRGELEAARACFRSIATREGPEAAYLNWQISVLEGWGLTEFFC